MRLQSPARITCTRKVETFDSVGERRTGLFFSTTKAYRHKAIAVPRLSDIQPFPFWLGFAILSVKQGDQIFSLFYVLWDRVRRDQSRKSWP